MQRSIVWRGLLPLSALVLVFMLAFSTAVTANPPKPIQSAAITYYTNPLRLEIPGGALAETCADPSVIRGQTADDPYWYMYCTTDPLTSTDKVAGGGFNFRLMPMYRSMDLVNWIYVDDAFDRPGPGADPARLMPSWAEASAGMWAPEIDYFNGKYYLYYGVTDVKQSVSGEADCPNDNAIGVATSDSPTGPWVDSGDPVVDPRRNGPCNYFWTYDPDVIVTPQGQKYIYYGSYYGGIFAQQLSEDGLEAVGTPTQVTIANRYEGSEVVYRDGFYYLFVSATNCCAGERTGYAVFVGRSASPTGPFVDQQGNSLLAGRVGGTPFLIQNGNEWIGVGHNTVFQDLSGQWWTIYHGVNRNDPYLANAGEFTKRPVLLDPIDWSNGWPTVNGGAGPSNTLQDTPVAQPGDLPTYEPQQMRQEMIGPLLPQFSEEFNSATLNSRWSWVREPAATEYQLTGTTFRLNAQRADLYQAGNTASILTAPLPGGNYVVETRVRINNLPAEGCCHNYTQAGILIYGDDDNYIKHVVSSIWETRQTEFAKESNARYGNTVGGAVSEWTYLRISARTAGNEQYYTAFTSQDGQTWVRGGTWAHNLGANVRIGLVSMGVQQPTAPGGPPADAAYTAEFDYVRVYGLLTPRVYLPLILYRAGGA